ncbi:hypothetical protein I79_024654 [Cricetulus griseus]|uniref:Uncharacterized protein n=1 Tax=Cricetulus griseus TaxID=10029 RepID=G3IL91_CRIGR|nr:hypothetical protein I79_024654 [Cricetulus griseus]
MPCPTLASSAYSSCHWLCQRRTRSQKVRQSPAHVAGCPERQRGSSEQGSDSSLCPSLAQQAGFFLCKVEEVLPLGQHTTPPLGT